MEHNVEASCKWPQKCRSGVKTQRMIGLLQLIQVQVCLQLQLLLDMKALIPLLRMMLGFSVVQCTWQSRFKALTLSHLALDPDGGLACLTGLCVTELVLLCMGRCASKHHTVRFVCFALARR